MIEEIAPGDLMHRDAPDYYFQAGRDALRCIRVAMAEAGVERVDTILDLPCGHGRVLRTLKAAFPEAALTACDIRDDGIQFCASVLGATPIRSVADPARIPLAGSFDLIWCGSLLTHVGEPQWDGFLALFESVLTPGGLLLFTTFGPRIAEERVRKDVAPLDLDREQRRQILAEYDRTGFGHCDDRSGFLQYYGDTIASPSWVCTKLESFAALRLVLYLEAGWGKRRDHWSQDVFACAAV
jgi:SAM-dependent methyltransferase